MYLAVDENGNQITAVEAMKHKKYFCPVCDAPVTFKSGNIKLPHFSHHRILDCIRYMYKKESIEHLQAKHDLYLKVGNIARVAMEYYLPDIEQIPDLLVDNKLALEIQFSTIPAELIAERSKGYFTLGMEVIWLLDEASIRVDNDRCIPTHFQFSTAYQRSLFTYSKETGKMHRFILHLNHGCGRWSFTKTELSMEALLKRSSVPGSPAVKLTVYEVQQMIRREKQQKSVLNPTLSFMYHTGLNAKNLPPHLCWTIEAERWIVNPPLEWKLFLYHHIEKGIFHWEAFERFIQMRTVQDKPSKQQVMRDLLDGYYMLYNSQ